MHLSQVAIITYVMVLGSRTSLSPPQFAQGLAELGVVERGILVAQPPPGGLGPHHEGVHGALHVRALLVHPKIERPQD